MEMLCSWRSPPGALTVGTASCPRTLQHMWGRARIWTTDLSVTCTNTCRAHCCIFELLCLLQWHKLDCSPVKEQTNVLEDEQTRVWQTKRCQDKTSPPLGSQKDTNVIWHRFIQNTNCNLLYLALACGIFKCINQEIISMFAFMSAGVCIYFLGN